MNMLERFYAKVAKADCDGCWHWTASRSADGYGFFRYGGRMGKAHRFAYETLLRPIPDGKHIDHLCRNRACVNPWHMEPVTNHENVLRGNNHAAQNARKTHCINGHLLAGDNLVPSFLPRRQCRICHNARTRATYHRQRTAL